MAAAAENQTAAKSLYTYKVTPQANLSVLYWWTLPSFLGSFFLTHLSFHFLLLTYFFPPIPFRLCESLGFKGTWGQPMFDQRWRSRRRGRQRRGPTQLHCEPEDCVISIAHCSLFPQSIPCPVPLPRTGRKCSLKASPPTAQAQRSQSANENTPPYNDPNSLTSNVDVHVAGLNVCVCVLCTARCFMSASLQIPVLQKPCGMEMISPLNTLMSTCTYTSTHVPLHAYTCHFVGNGYKRGTSQCSSTGSWIFLFKTSWRTSPKGHSGFWKQRGIGIDKGALTAQLHWKNAQCRMKEFGITITCDLWFMNGVDKFMDVCWRHCLSSSSSSSRCA